MAEFDVALADLEAKLAAMNEVLLNHPDVAAEVVAAVDAATVDAAKAKEGKAQDDARANALARAVEAARDSLGGESSA